MLQCRLPDTMHGIGQPCIDRNGRKSLTQWVGDADQQDCESAYPLTAIANGNSSRLKRSSASIHGHPFARFPVAIQSDEHAQCNEGEPMIVDDILKIARDEKRTVLTEIEAKQILKEAGINCTDTQLAASKEEAVALSEKMGYPVVLKISSVDITHKSDAGGVKVNLKDKTAVEKAYDDIMASCTAKYPSADIEGVAVQGMAKLGTEVIIGMTKDPSFGPVLMFGLGGIFVEVLKDVAFRIVPLEKNDASEMINEIKGKKLLEGYRGQDPADIPFLEDMLLKLSALVDKTESIAEIDMNPVFAYKQGAVVVDARIILEAN
jgi:acetate---CoA ligase (ADP-forming) subunit beta